MDARKLMSNYLAALAAGEPEKLTMLFTADGVVVSPLYGTRPAAAFCNALAADTAAADVTPLRYFMSPDGAMAAQFLYRWTLVTGNRVDFECMAVFEFAGDGRINRLTTIYDTHPWRGRFSELAARPADDARKPTAAAKGAADPGAQRSGVIPFNDGAEAPAHDPVAAQRHDLAAEDRVLSAAAQAMLDALPAEERPNELARVYPRIVNAIARHQVHPDELQHYFASLLTPDRKDRQGFPFKVLMDLESLKTSLLRAHHKPDPFWD